MSEVTRKSFIVGTASFAAASLGASDGKPSSLADLSGDLADGKSSVFHLNDRQTVGNLILQSTRPYSSNMVLSHRLCTLSVFTDIHGCKENLKRYVDFSREYGRYIDDMLCLGDMVPSSFADPMDFWDGIEGTEKILKTIGNHDTLNSSLSEADWSYHSGKESYVRYFQPQIGSWGVVQPVDAEEKGFCWYYKDYAEAKVRLIVLDCMFVPKDTGDEQLHWFAQALSDAKEKGLSVVAAKHFPFEVIQDSENNTFNSIDMKPYNGGHSMMKFVQEVDAFVSSGGDFICWMHGDSHYDYQGVVKGHPAQYCIAFENASLNSQWNDSVRIRGSKSQDSFNFVTFDTNSKLIKIVRVGNNSDRYLRQKNCLCYDYKRKKTITCK